MMNNVVFNSKDEELIFEYLYTVDDYLNFNIKVKTGEFSGASSFCISKKIIIEIINQLSMMISDLRGVCELRDYDSDSHIAFESLSLGHVSVFGQIGGSHQDNNLRFKYVIDQTGLNNILKILEESLLST